VAPVLLVRYISSVRNWEALRICIYDVIHLVPSEIIIKVQEEQKQNWLPYTKTLHIEAYRPLGIACVSGYVIRMGIVNWKWK